MAIKASGSSLKFSEIEYEFGQNNDRDLGEYRVSESHGQLSNMPLDTGIPQSGQIKFSQFYGKKLNIVVDMYSGGTEYRKNARSDKYNNGNLHVIGGFRNAPNDSGEAPIGGVRGKKVFIHVNKTFGSGKTNPMFCAVRTGSWQSDTELRIDVGTSGKIYGSGGDGGPGCNGVPDQNNSCSNDAIKGKPGTSALGIEYAPAGNQTVVNNNGRIICGFGGGGGGGSARQEDGGKWTGRQDRSASGGGGGGGAGLPFGTGGAGLASTWDQGDELISGTAGEAGATQNGGEQGGEGGEGGNNGAGEAVGGEGGNGGDETNLDAEAGAQAPAGKFRGSGGTAGARGDAIRRDVNHTNVSITGSGTLVGSTSGAGVA